MWKRDFNQRRKFLSPKATLLLTLVLSTRSQFDTSLPVRTSRNFFRLGSAFLEGEMAEPKKSCVKYELMIGMISRVDDAND